MTTMEHPAEPGAALVRSGQPGAALGPLRVTLPRLLWSEWIKLRSVRSTPW